MAGRQELAVFMLAFIEGTVLFRRVLLSSESSLALSVGSVFSPRFFLSLDGNVVSPSSMPF